MKNILMFIVGFIFFAIYVFFYFRIVLRQKFGKKGKKVINLKIKIDLL